MNTAYISALAALAGSAIGALASFLSTWITQRYQNVQARRSAESTRRERLFGDFIDQASKLYADAMTSSLDDPSKLVMLYATLSKLRLFASERTIAAAIASMNRIVSTYNSPNFDFSKGSDAVHEDADLLRDFTVAARDELRD